MNKLTGSDLTPKSLRITTHHHPKEYKLLSKRLMIKTVDHQADHQDHYHGGSSVSVPFTWESQPGTPKVVKFRETSLPPLTPPPSYSYSPVTSRPSQSNHRRGSPGRKTNNLVNAIFPRRSTSASPSLSPSSSTSDDSPVLRPSSSRRRIFRSPSKKESETSRVYDFHGEPRGSPVSMLCFGRSDVGARSASGCYSSFIKVLLS